MPNDWKLGTLADNARFIRERARTLSPEEGLAVLEQLRSMRYEDPQAPPRLERVFKLSDVRTKKRAGRPKDLLDIELLREAGLLGRGKR